MINWTKYSLHANVRVTLTPPGLFVLTDYLRHNKRFLDHDRKIQEEINAKQMNHETTVIIIPFFRLLEIYGRAASVNIYNAIESVELDLSTVKYTPFPAFPIPPIHPPIHQGKSLLTSAVQDDRIDDVNKEEGGNGHG